MKLLHRDAGQHIAVTVRQRAAQVVPLVEQARRHMVERHLLPERQHEETVRRQQRWETFFSLGCFGRLILNTKGQLKAPHIKLVSE